MAGVLSGLARRSKPDTLGPVEHSAGQVHAVPGESWMDLEEFHCGRLEIHSLDRNQILMRKAAYSVAESIESHSACVSLWSASGAGASTRGWNPDP